MDKINPLELPKKVRRSSPIVSNGGRFLARGVTRRSLHLSQQVTVKSGSSLGRKPHAWGQYGRKYLMREGVSKENENGMGFSRAEEGVDLGKEMGAWQKAGDRHYYHIVISPEQGKELHLPDYSRELMGQVERDLRTKLEWVGIEHHNTQTPHVHMMVRGIHEQGQELSIGRNYLYYGMIARAEELATNRLGYRLTEHTLAMRERTLERESFTETDKGLMQKVDEQHILQREREVPSEGADRIRYEQETRRLQYLADLGLAKQLDIHRWQVYHNLKEELHFRAANREFVAEWRKIPEQDRGERIEERNHELRQRAVRIIEQERTQEHER